MKCLISFLTAWWLLGSSVQTAVAQSVALSNKAVFYNFIVSKCGQSTCDVPFLVSLDNVNLVTGSFKGLNNRIQPVYEPGGFLIAVYNLKSGAKEWETVVPNPVRMDVEFDGEHDHGHSHQHSESTLQRKIIELDEGSMAVRLPYEPHECRVTVSYIASPNEIIPIASY